MTIPTINLELMLAGWQESHSGGAKLTFWLPDGADLEPFKAMTAKKGGTAGQRFMAVLALLGDDEQPVSAAEPKAVSAEKVAEKVAEKKPPLGPRAKLAVQLCTTPEFQDWIRPHYDRVMGGNGSSWGDVVPEDFTDAKTEKQKREAWAAHVVKVFCGCTESRRELDDDPDCARLFEERIRRPWLAHQEVAA